MLIGFNPKHANKSFKHVSIVYDCLHDDMEYFIPIFLQAAFARFIAVSEALK